MNNTYWNAIRLELQKLGSQSLRHTSRYGLLTLLLIAATSLMCFTQVIAAGPGSQSESSASGVAAPWWDTAWLVRVPLTIQNTAVADLPSHYSVKVSLDTSLLLRTGQLLADCSDLRVVYFDGANNHELDRVVGGCGSSDSYFWFSLQNPILAGTQDTSYYVYYQNPSAAAAPANGMNVFLFFEDWENGPAHWTSAGGLDAGNTGTMGTSVISTDVALSPTHSQEFVQKGSGGDAFSGFIPVTPNTTYEISVAASSSTSAYFPVGFDPYSSTLSRGPESWLWTSEWTLVPQWTQHAGSFTTDAGTAYIKIKSEWWTQGPGTTPVYADDLKFRYVASPEPALSEAPLETAVPAPTLANVQATGSVSTGTPTVFSADVYQTAGIVDRVTVHLLSPTALDIPMTLASGDTASGTWSAQFTAPRGGVYTYLVSAHATNGTVTASSTLAFTVINTQSSWWDPNWLYRSSTMVQNTSTSQTIPASYATKLSLDTGLLVRTGQLQPTCGDLRIVYFDGVAFNELDRIIDSCGADHSDIWFPVQRSIPVGAQDTSYYIYYGNAAAALPPANGMHVFRFYEDWEAGAAHWASAGGLDPASTGSLGTSVISTDTAVSPNHSQKFTQKTSGGDAFTGLIPVSPNTRYEIAVWATSATPAYFPVGLDPYTASYNRGAETWLWTSEWVLTPQWIQRSSAFTTDATTAFIKIKSEWWSSGPGSAPVYSDNLRLRPVLGSEPLVAAGSREASLSAPSVTNIQATSPVQVGSSVTVTADVSQGSGYIDSVTVRLLSPQAMDVPMALLSGNYGAGNWGVQFSTLQAGVYSYSVSAHASNGTATASPMQTFTVIDTIPPQITLISVVNPIPTRNTQTVTVQVLDNGQVSSVSLIVDGNTYPMTPNGNQYSSSWRVLNAGTISYTVQATDTAGNTSTFASTFVAQALDADVCNWRGCKAGAESFSVDDTHSSCETDLEDAGFRGTYYIIGSAAPDWGSSYSAMGHELGSHTVSHSCNTPCCTPFCTPASLSLCPFTSGDVTSYRQNELEPNIAGIEASTHKPVITAAWPCGCTDPGREAAAASYLIGARGYYDYVAQLSWVENVNDITPLEPMNLWAAHAYDQSFIDRAASEGKWAIIVSHGDCTGIDYMGQRQDMLWAAPVGDVLKYIKVRDAANFSNYSRSGNTITFDVSHNLGVFQRQKLDGTNFLPLTYDNPVTLKVHILDTDAVLGVQVNGAPVVYSVQQLSGVRFVLFDASLEIPRHVVVSLGSNPAIAALALTPATVAGGSSSVGTVTLSSPAPSGGALVTILSSNTAVAQVPANVTVSTGSSTATFSVSTSAVAAETPVTVSASYSGTTQSATLTVDPVEVLMDSLTLSSSNVVGGNTTTGTVVLNAPAPIGGALVALISDDPSTVVPANVTVAANQQTATFPITTSLVPTSISANIVAMYRGNSLFATLTVLPVTIAAVSVNPATVIGGNPATGTVTLSVAAPIGGIVVALSSDNLTAQVPQNVAVAVNATSATFPVSTSVVTANTSATLSASFNSTVRTATLTVTPVPVTPSSLVLNPTAVIGGASSTATVTLTGPSPAGGTVVTLASNNTSVATVSGNVTVPAGSASATFSVTSKPVRTTTVATISATCNSGTATAGLTVNPSSLTTVSLNPTSLVGGSSSTATVTLDGPAPSGGALVTLSSSNTAAAQTPANVTVPANATSATFGVTTRAVTATTSVTISASYNSTTKTAVLTVNPPALTSVSLSPTSVVGGSSSTGTVTLSGAAPSGGAQVGLTSSNTAVAQVPASVTVAAGSTTATFAVQTNPLATSASSVISATFNGTARTATLTVTAPALASLSLNPTSVVGGNSSSGTVTLNGIAAAAIVVNLTSSNVSVASVPSNVVVTAGSSSVSFAISTNPVSSSTSPTISAIYGSTTRSQNLTVNSPSISSLSLSPTSVRGGNSSAGTVTLDGSAPAGGISVTLSSSNTSVATVPSSVSVPAGSTSATFTVTSRTVTSTRTVTISGTRNRTRSAVLTVTP